MSLLFDPLVIGDWQLPNRIIMAPLTRCRASAGRIPNELMAQYYQQRASAGLIFSEATSVSPMGVGYPNTPGIWSAEQVNGWQGVTTAVHQAGGRILLQLWHVGRISHSLYLDGEQPLAPSAIAAQGHVSLVRPETAYPVPRALALDEIPLIVQQYAVAAQNAKLAGFDGVEIHAANGYLIDQFLQSASNKRNDAYGGSIANRARLLLEITDAVTAVWGANKVGVHLAPRGDAHSMGDDDPRATFGYCAEQLGQRKLAFLFTREHFNAPALTPELKKAFGGPVIINEGMSVAQAEKSIAAGEADAVAFGRKFIANPDLPYRLQQGTPLNKLDADTLYTGGAHGYTDYPAIR